MSKYEPLRQYLQALPRRDRELKFEEIEEILGFKLPRSAHEHSAWWSNERGTHVQARAWMDADWQVLHVRRSDKKVYFRPVQPEAAEPEGVSDVAAPFVGDERVILFRMSSLRGSAIRLLDDYCEENGGTVADAIAGILNAKALERRRELVDWFRANSPPVSGDSTDVIREERDAR